MQLPVKAAPKILPQIPPARVFYDGLFATPKRLAHPECVAVAADNSVWCGTENGELMRIAPDGSAMACMGETGGFILGIAFDSAGQVYACDFLKAVIWRRDAESGEMSVFASGPRIPNFPVVDEKRNCLYVSDSGAFGEIGPGIWRYDLATGAGTLWCDHAFNFANGMALHPNGNSLAVVETFGASVAKVEINEDGSAGIVSQLVSGVERLPDGLAYDAKGNLFISCYEPSRIYRLDISGRLSIFLDDPTAHLMCHPTNIAFRGSTLFAANLGRWHITAIETDTIGVPLPVQMRFVP